MLDEASRRAHRPRPRALGRARRDRRARRWFTYHYWLDDARAPDFARTVDIHRKPGYDPVELFLDPALPLPKLKIAATLREESLGFRDLMDVIPLDASLVKGSHGRLTDTADEGPLHHASDPACLHERGVNRCAATCVKDISSHVFQRLGARDAALEDSVSTKPRQAQPARAHAPPQREERRIDERDAGDQEAGSCAAGVRARALRRQRQRDRSRQERRRGRATNGNVFATAAAGRDE